MQQVDILLTQATIVTMNEEYTVILNGAIAIKGKQIVAVGTVKEISSQYQAEEVVDCNNLTIIPGLVNAHTHVPMTLLRGLADDLRLDVWLMGYMMPTEQRFVDPAFVRLGTQLACAEMIYSGITTFADMYYFEEHVSAATAEAGMRAVCGQTILKYPTPDAANYEEGLERCQAFIEEWKNHSLITPSISPHAPYTSTPDMLEKCRNLALEYDVPVHIHIAETALEQEESRRDYGMPVVPWIKKTGLLDAKIIAAHCVHLDQGEIRTIQHNNGGISHNPSSNMKLASGIAPVQTMLDLGVNVGIGTDGPASNNDLDMFEEIRLASFLAKIAEDDPTTLPARETFEMATRMGAKALHLGDVTGSIEPGKRADIVIIDLNRAHNWPKFSHDENSIYTQLVYAARSTDVQSVMCDGKWILKDRELTTLEVEQIMDAAQDYAKEIDLFIIEHKQDVLSKLLAVGPLERRESYEIQVKAQITNADIVNKLLKNPAIEIIKHSHYNQHDTYFEFGPTNYYRVRYREDYSIIEAGSVPAVRTRLTLTSNEKEHEFKNAVVLSKSRFISDADRPLRFYREYFQAPSERQITKERRRWHVNYQDTLFYVNLDVLDTSNNLYLEIKSTTWSQVDAENKSHQMAELLDILGIPSEDLIREEYVAL